MKDVLEVIFVRVAGSSINGQPPAEEKLKSKTISLFLTLECCIMYSPILQKILMRRDSFDLVAWFPATPC